ncbi:MAG TPA: AI-2E family transporter [Solirubrobacteraceae bacterium]|nr:AI-2E family transporter [Solirubrobacteraceae bacterium]
MSESRVTPGTVYRAVLLAFALVVAALLFKQLVTLILAVLIVVIIALPLAAFANLLNGVGVPRAFGALIGLLLGLGAIAGLVALVLPAFSHEINKFAASLPSIVDDLRHRLAGLTGTSPSRVGNQIQHFVNGYTQHPTKLLGPAASIGASVAGGIAALVVVLLTALYSAIHPDPLVYGLVRVVPPQGRPKAKLILCRLRVAYLGWLRGLVIGMCVLGGITYLGLQLVGLGFAAFFAIFTAVAMIVPYFGALASSIPPILYALTISPGKAVLVAIVYVLAHQLESNVIQPLVVARTVKLHPAVVAIGVVAVDRLFGFLGLVVAVPILATVQILVEELWIKPTEESHRKTLVADDPATEQRPRRRIAPPRADLTASG